MDDFIQEFNQQRPHEALGMKASISFPTRAEHNLRNGTARVNFAMKPPQRIVALRWIVLPCKSCCSRSRSSTSSFLSASVRVICLVDLVSIRRSPVNLPARIVES